jgi:hypothetical protein
MASIEEAVYSRMTGFAELSALIATRLYPVLIPQEVDAPAVAYQVISSVPARSHTSFNSTETRVQFTCQAATYANAKAVSKAVRHCWESFRGTVDGILIGSAFVENELDTGPEAAVRRVDVRIRHDED